MIQGDQHSCRVPLARYGEALPVRNTGGLWIMQGPNRQCGQGGSSRLHMYTIGEIKPTKSIYKGGGGPRPCTVCRNVARLG